jgi:protein farnesyltransferase subunit beta
MKKRCCTYLRKCWNDKEGGFAGAPGLEVHIASNYAAMLAIVNIATEEAYDLVDPAKMKACLGKLKNNMDFEYENKSFSNSWVFTNKETGEEFKSQGVSQVLGTLPGAIAIHENGEMDMRGVFCGLIVADIVGVLDDNEELRRGVGDFIASCQTYEGGISCAPFGEAHGGYTFCGLAALLLLGEEDKLDLDRCLDWLAQR